MTESSPAGRVRFLLPRIGILLAFSMILASAEAEGPDSADPPDDAAVVESTPPPQGFSANSEPPLVKIVHPSEGAFLPAVKSSFVFGWADPKGRLSVNGRPVDIHPGGGWITMLSYSSGPFRIEAQLQTDTTAQVVQRLVNVAGPVVPSSAPVVLSPEVSLWLSAGERVMVQAQGPPGWEASFEVGGLAKRYPLTESAGPSPGLYRGYFVIPEKGILEDSEVKVLWLNKKTGVRLTSLAPGRLTRWEGSTPRVVEVSVPTAILLASPSPNGRTKCGYTMFPPPGTKLSVNGRRGNEFRVALAVGHDAWIGVDDVTEWPSPAVVPRAIVSGLSVEPLGRHTAVRAALSAKVPFEVRPGDDGRVVDVYFYGAVSDTDWVHYRGTRRWVRRVEWFQEATDVYLLRIHSAPGSWWGYDARYDNGGFTLELRRPPDAPGRPSSLEGLLVAVDAGHSADSGARGPTEYLEKDANRAIADCLEKKLRKAGAEVVQIRRGDENVKVYDRPARAWAARADVLVSVHNNALPEGANPFERNGFGVYYFQPQSFGLASSIHAAYQDTFGPGGTARSKARLRDDGLHYGNLALPRTPQMPAVLTESAYMILPSEEAHLKNEPFQCDCADAMVRGLKRFVGDFRRLGEGAP